MYSVSDGLDYFYFCHGERNYGDGPLSLLKFVFLVSCVEERSWWPLQSPKKDERKKRKAKRRERDPERDLRERERERAGQAY